MAGTFVNTSYPPVRLDVEGFGVLAPGETAEDVDPSEHNKALEDEGALTRVRASRDADNTPDKGGKE